MSWVCKMLEKEFVLRPKVNGGELKGFSSFCTVIFVFSKDHRGCSIKNRMEERQG